jgi:hypothetical protein
MDSQHAGHLFPTLRGTTLSDPVYPVPHPAQPVPDPKPKSGLAITALVIGIVAFLVGWVPIFGLLIGAVAGVFGVLALVRRQRKGFSITGIVLGGLAAVTSLIMTIVVFNMPPAPRSAAPQSSAVASAEETPDAEPSEPAPPAPSTESEPEPEPEPETEPDPVPDLSQFPTVDDRTFALIAKDPDAHADERLIVFGVITQFDANTGTCSFRASTSAAQQETSWDYGENTFLDAEDCDLVATYVTGDHFKAWASVVGAVHYDTQIGGSTTALQLSVAEIELLPELEY